MDDLLNCIYCLNAEIEALKHERDEAENMLEYERNKYARQLASKESGIMEQILESISLELQALDDIADCLEESDRRRIHRRVERIKRILEES